MSVEILILIVGCVLVGAVAEFDVAKSKHRRDAQRPEDVQ